MSIKSLQWKTESLRYKCYKLIYHLSFDFSRNREEKNIVLLNKHQTLLLEKPIKNPSLLKSFQIEDKDEDKNYNTQFSSEYKVKSICES